MHVTAADNDSTDHACAQVCVLDTCKRGISEDDQSSVEDWVVVPYLQGPWEPHTQCARQCPWLHLFWPIAMAQLHLRALPPCMQCGRHEMHAFRDI